MAGALLRTSVSSADTAAGIRRGLYALLADIARAGDSLSDWTGQGGGKDGVHASLRLLLEMLRGCRGGCAMCAEGICAGGEGLRAECFQACSGLLREMMGSANLAPGKLCLVLSAVAELAEVTGPRTGQPRAAAVIEEISRAFGAAVVRCVLRCKGKPELRPALQLALSALGAVLDEDRAALGLKDVLGSCQFRDVLTLVERELRLPSVRPSTGARPYSADPVDQQTTGDAGMSRAIAGLVDSLHSCPLAWAAASAARRKFSPYVLWAL